MTEIDDDKVANLYNFLELFPSFGEASRRARQLASKYDGLVCVKRDNDSFKILVPLWVKNEVLSPPQIALPTKSPQAAGNEGFVEEQDFDSTDKELAREQEELLNDVYGDREDWGRSTEEGWFYDDSEN